MCFFFRNLIGFALIFSVVFVFDDSIRTIFVFEKHFLSLLVMIFCFSIYFSSFFSFFGFLKLIGNERKWKKVWWLKLENKVFFPYKFSFGLFFCNFFVN